jgi:hypothetical protein
MPQFQIFSIDDPQVKVVTTIEAGSQEEARGKARAMHRSYSAVPVSNKGAQTVQLKEDAPAPVDMGKEMRRLSESMNPGRSDSFHEEFVRGRDSGGPLEALGGALGYEGRLLEAFLKGRN